MVDTSIWIDHFRRGDRHLKRLLTEGAVLIHPFVIEEIACGNMADRAEILGLLETLPQSPGARHTEFLSFVADSRLFGLGLGAIDAHLLASARLAQAPLWSRDRRMREAAARLGVLYVQR